MFGLLVRTIVKDSSKTRASDKSTYEKAFSFGGKCKIGLKTTVRDNMWSVVLSIHYNARD